MSESSENPDYREQGSVVDIHASVQREKEMPSSGRMPMPWWCFFLVLVVAALGLPQLLSGTGGFRMDQVFAVADYTPAARPVSLDQEDEVDERPWIEKWMADGKKVYATCAACHQSTGQGVPGQYPPLVASEWVTGGTERLAAILLSGVQGPLKVKGVIYGSVAMPAQGAVFTDEQLAQVMTYIRRTWGNDASVVTEEMFVAAREKHGGRVAAWTEGELLELGAEANLPGEIPDLLTGEVASSAQGS
ncbi:MAG: cytochrome c [Verrucomicrobiota bacterium]